jgi:hypothetical protein
MIEPRSVSVHCSLPHPRRQYRCQEALEELHEAILATVAERRIDPFAERTVE